MGMFSDVGNAAGLSDTNYLSKDGNYLARVDRVKSFTSRKNGDMVAIEFTILADMGDKPETGDPSRHAAGEQCSYLIMQKSEYFLQEVKAFIQTAFRCDFSTMDAAQAEEACNVTVGEDQPLAGTIVRVTAQTVPTKAGGSFCKVRWREEVSPADMVELLSEAALARLYKGDAMAVLEALIEERTAEDAAAAAAAE